MSRSNPKTRIPGRLESDDPDEIIEWAPAGCDFGETQLWSSGSFGSSSTVRPIGSLRREYVDNWADSVPELVGKLASLIEEKKKQEIQFNLLQIAISEFEGRIHRLESIQTKIIPIDSFAPEPYNLLKTILVSVHSVEGGFNAGWFDANIHSSGDNEEEAAGNLKSLILDFFDSLSNEPAEKLGPEPLRQLAVLKEYIQNKS